MPSSRGTVSIEFAPTPDLVLPDRSLSDGTKNATVVSAYLLTGGLRLSRVSWPIDAIAKRRAKRINRIRLCGVATLALAGSSGVTVVLLIAFLRKPLLIGFALVALVAALMISIGCIIAGGLIVAPTLYPRWSSGGRILIDGVDRSVAEEWRDLNPSSNITVAER